MTCWDGFGVDLFSSTTPLIISLIIGPVYTRHCGLPSRTQPSNIVRKITAQIPGVARGEQDCTESIRRQGASTPLESSVEISDKIWLSQTGEKAISSCVCRTACLFPGWNMAYSGRILNRKICIDIFLLPTVRGWIVINPINSGLLCNLTKNQVKALFLWRFTQWSVLPWRPWTGSFQISLW